MLGSSSSLFDACIRQVIAKLQPTVVLELGCGQGKFAGILREQVPTARIKAVQKIFSERDVEQLRGRGYEEVIDRDIMEYFRDGFDEQYNMIVALDVIEHFLYSDILSIINFSLYRADYMLLVWPSEHPQSATSNPFDRHRASFDLSDLVSKFDVVFYTQTGFAQLHFVHRYHVVLLRGFMNVNVFPPLLP